jgi:hypothetical protein
MIFIIQDYLYQVNITGNLNIQEHEYCKLGWHIFVSWLIVMLMACDCGNTSLKAAQELLHL